MFSRLSRIKYEISIVTDGKRRKEKDKKDRKREDFSELVQFSDG
jgi:hypothetical protein